MRVAIVSPLPPSPTGIADYTNLLLRVLTRRRPDWEVLAVTATETPAIDASIRVHAPETFPEGNILPVYHLGNSRHHDFVYPLLFRHPGVLVLHDLVLHHARLSAYLDTPAVRAYREDMADSFKRSRANDELARYAAEVEACYPGRGATVAEIALRSGGGRFLYAYPLVELPVRASTMTLVHSRTAREALLAACPDAVVHTVRMGVELPALVDRGEARRRLGLGPGLLLASFGLVTPEKQISVALRALGRLLEEGMDARYVLVGGTVPHYDVQAEAAALGLGDRVMLLGRVSEEFFWQYAFAADMCLNLRYPSGGETSATLMRLLAAGRTVLVTDQLHYLDLPEDVALRVEPGDEETGIYCAVRDLLRQPERRRELEKRARAFIEREHTVESMVSDYVRCLEEARDLEAPPLPPHRLPAHLR